MDNPNVIRVNRTECLTDAVLTELKRNYSGLNINTPANSKTIDLYVASLSPNKKKDIMLDITFKLKNPKLPLENLCNRMENYKPKNATQEELLYFAQELIDLQISGRAAGLFMYGDTGVGKTHIAVAITKELMKKGQEVGYVNTSDISYLEYPKLGSDQVWVLDDLNSPYGYQMDVFKKIVLNAHNNGGRVFVTSNTLYDTLMENGFVAEEQQKPKFLDRIKGMFKILHITGESARQKDKWYAGMDFTPLQQLKIDLAKAVKEEDYETAVKIRDQIEAAEKKEKNLID